jgi:hypothetical protein
MPTVIGSNKAEFDQAEMEKRGQVKPKKRVNILSILRKHGRPAADSMDAIKKLSEGHRVFVSHEQDERPKEVHNVGDLEGYAPDQIYTVHPKHMISG